LHEHLFRYTMSLADAATASQRIMLVLREVIVDSASASKL
jgi:hypothetical protein